MTFFSYLLPSFFAVLQAAVAVLLLRGPFRRYPILLLYCCVQLGWFIADGMFLSSNGVGSQIYRTVYWTGDVIQDLLLFFLVAALTYRVIEGNPLHAGIGRILQIIAAAAVVLPFVLYHPYFTGRWFRHTSQLLSLGAAFMNLLLWTAILGRKGGRDRQLMMVSVGLGIAVTGLAVSYGPFKFTGSNTIRLLADLFKALTQVAGSAMWCWAFWPAPKRKTTGGALVEQPQS